MKCGLVTKEMTDVLLIFVFVLILEIEVAVVAIFVSILQQRMYRL